jgi:hypothetical protein
MAAAANSTVQFVGGQCSLQTSAPSGTAKAFDIESSVGVQVTNMQFAQGFAFSTNGWLAAIYANGSSSLDLSGNTFNPVFGVSAIVLNNTNYSSVTHNSVVMTGGIVSSVLINLTGTSSNNTIASNNLTGSGATSTGILFGASAASNFARDNVITGTTALITDSNGTNSWNTAANTVIQGAIKAVNLAGTGTRPTCADSSGNLGAPGSCTGTGSTTNPLTVNNSGSGDASGFTFNGGVAKTLSYNSIGALAANSGTFTGTPDASGATQFKLPVSAGFASLANGECGYDSTNKNWHCWVNGADTLMLPLSGSFTSGHCGQPTLHGATWLVDDAGGACGVSGGGAAFSAITSGTNANALVMGTGGSLDVSGTGTINATKISGVAVSGTPSSGQVPTATSSSTATWQTPSGGALGAFSCSNVTSSRVINTVYQNTTGYPLWVTAVVNTVANNGTEIKLISDSSSTPTTQITGTGSTFTGFGIATVLYFVVKNNDYYQVPTSAGASSIASWTECSVTKGTMSISSELSGSRVTGTAYQNTSGSPILIEVELSGAGGTVAQLLVDTSSTPTTQVWKQSIPGSGGNMDFLIPVLNNEYYKVANVSGTATIQHIREITWSGASALKSVNLTSLRTLNSTNQNYLAPAGKSLWSVGSYQSSTGGSMVVYSDPGTGQGEGYGAALTTPVLPTFNISGMSATSNEFRSVSFPVGSGGVYDVKFDNGGTPTAQAWYEWVFY